MALSLAHDFSLAPPGLDSFCGFYRGFAALTPGYSLAALEGRQSSLN
jgi:hypothetical protein